MNWRSARRTPLAGRIREPTAGVRLVQRVSVSKLNTQRSASSLCRMRLWLHTDVGTRASHTARRITSGESLAERHIKKLIAPKESSFVAFLSMMQILQVRHTRIRQEGTDCP
ncbi:hypothetical protein DENSPDRAFT_453768 [Dentipellis sp. KUC8613]|nr:hypothetical protein DENSPDRAFT_453768 [Dentipellis sp. KUC8613]